MDHYRAVLPVIELTAGLPRRVEVEAVPICLCRVAEEVFAVHDCCTHQKHPLSDGALDGYRLTCAAHGACFDVRNGRVLRPPAFKAVRTYPARVRAGQVEIEL